MITHNDQMDLFRLISNNISMNIKTYAFGGNAMMFYGYKDETKDVDLLFEDEKQRSNFIKAIKRLGYEVTSPFKIYIPEKLRDKSRPLMFKRENSRFDLFVKKIFRTQLSPKMKEDLYAVHEFKGKHNLKINVLTKEYIVLLKAITERDKDFEDILTIISKEKNFDWQYVVDEAVWQHKHGDSWILIDLDKVMRELKKDVFIEQKYFRQIYKEQNGGRK
jgi:hypothetical protein